MPKKVLALNINGDITYCSCSPEQRGVGRCNHIEHQKDGESPAEFVERMSELQKDPDFAANMQSAVAPEAAEGEGIKPFGEDAFIPYEGTTVVTKPYRMTDEEKSELVKIENRMQLEQNMDGGYMELEVPLWNDMDRKWFSQESGMSVKDINSVLYGESYLILESDSSRFGPGKTIPKSTLEEWEKSEFPKGWDENCVYGTGVEFMNKWALESQGFTPTKDVYVLPYYMRMGIADHTMDYGSSSCEDGVAGEESLESVSSDITIAYKYMLRAHARPDQQQLAYDALLNNNALDDEKARFTNGHRNSCLADEFAGKGGVFRAVLSGGSVPYTGRAVAVPNADLPFGEIGIPSAMAVDIFRPTLLKQLASEGKSMEEIDRWVAHYRIPQHAISPKDKKELEERIGHLRVAMMRQPSLHQPSLQSFRPRISRGVAVETNPLIAKGYNLDHDGDEVNIAAFNNVDIIPVVDRSIAAELPVNTRLPRNHDSLSIMPSKDSLFGLLSILQANQNS